MKIDAQSLLASFCLVATAAMADDSCKMQATGKKFARRRTDKLLTKKCCNGQAAATRNCWRRADELHEKVHTRTPPAS